MGAPLGEPAELWSVGAIRHSRLDRESPVLHQFLAGSRYNYGKIFLYLQHALKQTTNTNKHMPRFLITTKSRTQFNGIRIEPGMSVEVVTTSFANPLLVNGGQPVVDAFLRIYGIDIKKAGVCSTVHLVVKQIG